MLHLGRGHWRSHDAELRRAVVCADVENVVAVLGIVFHLVAPRSEKAPFAGRIIGGQETDFRRPATRGFQKHDLAVARGWGTG